MPTTYTHELFGRAVCQKLPEPIKELIQRHKMTYRIGQHGPDILFYYKPFQKNEINQYGHRMHAETAAEFFIKCRKLYLQTKDEEILSYVLGYVCHFMLDSTCHPYISQYMEKTGADHAEIETELDRALMERTGKNPLSYHPAHTLREGKEAVRAIAAVYGRFSEKQIRSCLWSMRLYTKITVCKSAWIRKLMLCGMKAAGIYDEVQGRVMRKIPIKRCEESTRELLQMIQCAIPETVTVIEEFYNTLNYPEELSYRFNRNYIE